MSYTVVCIPLGPQIIVTQRISFIQRESAGFFYTSKAGLGAEDGMTSDVMMGHAKIRREDVGRCGFHLDLTKIFSQSPTLWIGTTMLSYSLERFLDESNKSSVTTDCYYLTNCVLHFSL